MDVRTALFFNWLPLLVWVFAFFTTVYLVNLMIAKMTTTYETIAGDHIFYLAMFESEFVLEYKDALGAPPPFNIIVLLGRGLAFVINLVPLPPEKWGHRLRRSYEKVQQRVVKNLSTRVHKRATALNGYSVKMGRVATMRMQVQLFPLVRRLAERRLAMHNPASSPHELNIEQLQSDVHKFLQQLGGRGPNGGSGAVDVPGCAREEERDPAWSGKAIGNVVVGVTRLKNDVVQRRRARI